MSAGRRRRFFIDREVQGALVAKVLTYWVYCLGTYALFSFCWKTATGPADQHGLIFAQQHLLDIVPPAAATLVVVPLIIVDAMRWSNRFAGPAAKLRKALEDLGENRETPPLKFRLVDYWQGTADAFNVVAVQMQGSSKPGHVQPASEVECEPAAMDA